MCRIVELVVSFSSSLAASLARREQFAFCAMPIFLTRKCPPSHELAGYKRYLNGTLVNAGLKLDWSCRILVILEKCPPPTQNLRSRKLFFFIAPPTSNYWHNSNSFISSFHHVTSRTNRPCFPLL